MLCLLLTLAHASVEDRVVAVIDSQVVLASDARIAADLGARIDGVDPFWTREQASLEAALIRAAAGGLALYQPSPAQVRKRLAATEAAFGQDLDAFMGRWGFTRRDLADVITKRAVTESWLRRNVALAPDADGYLDEIDALLAALRLRYRVRVVQPIR